MEASSLKGLMEVLMRTGQMPPSKMVHVEDPGKIDVLGLTSIQRSWYTIAQCEVATPSEMSDDLVVLTQQQPQSSSSSSSDSAAPQKEVQLLPLSESTRDVEEGTRIELERFLEMMQSERACIWGECHRIAERRALEKEAQAAEEYAASPPWYSR